jgi:hypothetical protein
VATNLPCLRGFALHCLRGTGASDHEAFPCNVALAQLPCMHARYLSHVGGSAAQSIMAEIRTTLLEALERHPGW